jgi:hypothetical protein
VSTVHKLEFKNPLFNKFFIHTELFFITAWVTSVSEKVTVFPRGYTGFVNNSLELITISMSGAEAFNLHREEIIALFESLELTSLQAAKSSCGQQDGLNIFP